MNIALDVSFHGPIIFRLCEGVAWAYLPMCANHTCNILTDTNDISPKMHKVFELKGPTATKTKQGNGLQMIKLDWNKKWGTGPKARECYSIFKLPSPDVILGLRAEYVKIDIPNASGFRGSYARGLRFHYDHCDVAPTIGPSNGAAAGDLRKFKARYFDRDDLYQIEIRFHDTKQQKTIDHHHRDAMQCSRSMRKLLPPCDQWKVNFEPEESIENIGGKHPVDCGANLLVFTDGITL